MTMPRYRALSAWAAVAVGTAVACAPAPPAPAVPSQPQAGAAVPAAPAGPQRGGTITYASTTKVNSLHPFKLWGAVERRAGGPIYDTLLFYKDAGRYEVTFEVAPGLAERWEQPDPATYVFHLRKGVKWHDGRPFTADDVVFTYNYVRDRNNAFPIASQLSPITQIVKVDDSTVRITTQAPSPFLLQRLADFNFFVIPKHVVDGGDDLSKVGIGTGPFKVKSFDADSRSEYVRNEDYWQQGKPYLDGVTVHWVLDESARLAGFIARELDLWAAADKRQADGLLQSAADAVSKRVIPTYGDAFIMKLDRPPFNDARVRRAVHLAVDRQALIKTSAQGDGVINPPGMPGHKEGFAIPPEQLAQLPGYRQPKDQDLAEAKRLLGEAGYASGLKTSMIYDRRRNTDSKIAEPLAATLRPAGIEVELNGKDRPEYVKDLRERNYETALDFTASMSLNERQMPYLHSKGSQNTMGLADPKLDAILEALEVAMKVEDQKRLGLEIQRHLLETNYTIPTIEIPAYQVVQTWVRDHHVHPAGAAFMDTLSVNSTWIDADVKRKYKP